MKKNPVIKALEETGLPWELENGNSHKKIRLCGRLVGVMSATAGNKNRVRATLNVVSQIRRAARELKQ